MPGKPARPEIKVYARLCLKHGSFGGKKQIINEKNIVIDFGFYTKTVIILRALFGRSKTFLYLRHGVKMVLLFHIFISPPTTKISLFRHCNWPYWTNISSTRPVTEFGQSTSISWLYPSTNGRVILKKKKTFKKTVSVSASCPRESSRCLKLVLDTNACDGRGDISRVPRIERSRRRWKRNVLV